MINPNTESIDEPQRPISTESIDLIFGVLGSKRSAQYAKAAAELHTLLIIYHVMTGVDLEQG